MTYLSSEGGRLASGILAFAIAAAGLMGVLGPGPHVLYLVCAIPPVIIVGAIFAIGLSIERFERHALTLVLALPLLAGPYLAALWTLPRAGTLLGMTLLLLAIVPVAITVGQRRKTMTTPHTAAASAR